MARTQTRQTTKTKTAKSKAGETTTKSKGGRPKDNSPYAKKGGQVCFRPSLALDVYITKWEKMLTKREGRDVNRGELCRRIVAETFARLERQLVDGDIHPDQEELLPYEKNDHKVLF